MSKDFGNILDKWERGKTNVMRKWLEDNEVFDKDAVASETALPDYHRRRLMRSRLRDSEPDGIIDIHGLTAEEAQVSLENFFLKARSSNFKKLRVIHGKGNHSNGEAVLKNIVRKFIEKCPFAGESGYEKAVNGGSGVTWVLLK